MSKNINILYEDNHLLAVVKPPNVPVQADASGDADILSMLKDYIKTKYGKPGAVYLGLVHRLDRPVGGVMVFARTSKAAARLSAQFKSGEAAKRYAAIVDGQADLDCFFTDYLQDIDGEPRVRVYNTPADGAKKAMLRFHRIAAAGNASLLDVELLTGRKHQIRAQMAAHGHPILYDQRYHPNPKKGQIALWAYALTVAHPITKKRLTFHSVPENKEFSVFTAQVAGLTAFRAGYALYADSELLIADKREGVEVTSEDGGEISLQAEMERCFSALYPVHRIDATTRGLVVFARTEAAKEKLDGMFARGEIIKVYRCVVNGVPSPPSATLTAYAKKDSAVGVLNVRTEEFPGSAFIKTGYRVLEVVDGCSLLEVWLYTGKTHQIRAHLAFIGHPLIGDDKYGDRERNKEMRVKRPELTACSLEFQWRGEYLKFISTF